MQFSTRHDRRPRGSSVTESSSRPGSTSRGCISDPAGRLLRSRQHRCGRSPATGRLLRAGQRAARSDAARNASNSSGTQWSRSDEAHLSAKHVPELRQLVERTSCAGICPSRVTRGSCLILNSRGVWVLRSDAAARPFARRHPRPSFELEHLERSPSNAGARLPEEDGPARFKFDRDGDQNQQRPYEQEGRPSSARDPWRA